MRKEQIGNATLYCGDCIGVLNSLEDNSIDSVITDPPYNIGFSYNHYKDRLTDDKYLQWQIEIAKIAGMKLKDSGNFLYLNYPEFMAKYFYLVGQETFETHLESYRLIAWCYHTHTGGKPLRRSYRQWGWFRKGKENYINEDAIYGEYRNPNDKRIKIEMSKGRRPVDKDWWEYEQVKNVSREKTKHPCQLPLVMVSRLVQLSSPDGGLVVDPFMGSGTTGEAALSLGRKFIGIELDEIYFDIAVQRLKNLKIK
jgi:site-specific DNA-methyltransferase (adenine-specific)